MTDAMLGANDYVIYQEKALLEEEDWTLEPENTQKDFKLFKQLFVKKMENVITPVFYKLQSTYDGTLPETKIEQYTDENRCIFHLRSPKQTSRLTIVYPGFAKVVIYITHSGLDSPENKEYSIPLKAPGLIGVECLAPEWCRSVPTGTVRVQVSRLFRNLLSVSGKT